jgi:ubiquinone/menaquinone biosynthesis C-methylase UbiE/uncharacterized protein YbaR (Trm112 family)
MIPEWISHPFFERETSMNETTSINLVSFACPKCKRPLHSGDNAFYCNGCDQSYPIVEGIPDFLAGVLQDDHTLRMAKKVDLIAPIYESRIWYQLLLNLAGVGGISFQSIAHFHAETLAGVSGPVLDVACGPATYSRRIASSDRSVYGIDISQGMLRQGMTNVAREGIIDIHLARASVDELPFEDAVFDGVICSGSLHLFPDTVRSLREIARTMKPGAPLSVQTFVAGGQSGLMRLLGKWRDVKAFELPQLQQYLAATGFEQFQPKLDGIFLTFSVRKAPSRM